MRVNTKESIALGESLHEEFGSWRKVREASKLRDGVFVLPSKAETQPVQKFSNGRKPG